MKKTLRKVLPVLALVLVVAVASVGGTIAWLTDKTQEVKNTFTVGDVDVELTETTGSDYKIIPGTEISKNPKVKVTATSEDCWLFVKVTEVNWPDAQKVSYSINSAWTKLSETSTEEKDENDKVVKKIKTSVYYMKIDANNNQKNVAYSVLADDKIIVANTLTKDEANAIPTGDYAPTLSFMAYAIQQEGFNDANKTEEQNATAAWAEVSR